MAFAAHKSIRTLCPFSALSSSILDASMDISKKLRTLNQGEFNCLQKLWAGYAEESHNP
jgi:hypothetical protein